MFADEAAGADISTTSNFCSGSITAVITVLAVHVA
jgi:hypothetical protein